MDYILLASSNNLLFYAEVEGLKIDARCCDTIKDFRNIITVFKASDIEIEEAEISEKLFNAYAETMRYKYREDLEREEGLNFKVVLDGINCKVIREDRCPFCVSESCCGFARYQKTNLGVRR